MTFDEVAAVAGMPRPTAGRGVAAISIRRDSVAIDLPGGPYGLDLFKSLLQWAGIVNDRLGAASFLIQGPDDIKPEWLSEARCIGITAGASTPDSLVAEVEDFLESFQPDQN